MGSNIAEFVRDFSRENGTEKTKQKMIVTSYVGIDGDKSVQLSVITNGIDIDKYDIAYINMNEKSVKELIKILQKRLKGTRDTSPVLDVPVKKIEIKENDIEISKTKDIYIND